MEKIKCPECKKKLSTKAVMCPKCGCPISEMQANEISQIENNKTNKKKLFIPIVIIGVIAVIALTLSLPLRFNDNKASLKTIDDAMVKIVCYDPLDNIVSTGSGFFYKDDSHIVTNYHVIDGAYKIEYITNDERKYNVEYIYYYSSEMDIAVLGATNQVNEYKYLKAGSSNVEKGKKIFAIGSPLGIQNVLSEGIISGNYMIDGINAIQFTAPISSGSSGGALVDAKGEVIGITFASNEAGQNINLAIPIELLIKACPEWNNSMALHVERMYSDNHPWGNDINTMKRIAKDIQVVSLEDLKNNLEVYKDKRIVAFEAYVSSIFNTTSVYYFMTDKSNITKDSEYDLLEYYNSGAENSPYICVQTFGDEDSLDHIDEIKYGSKVWVIASYSGNELDSFYTYMLYDEIDNKYVSNVPTIVKELSKKD